ncbi:MAG: hypothetical protein FWG87_03300 [Defluviitaleaceae bacterium]|nr:hypothetical protein [Defluviitaleaceae bacterium]
MKVFSERSMPIPQLCNVRCNVCGRDVEKENLDYFEDHMSLTKTWGYFSPFDGEPHNIDLCIECYQDWITKFEIPPYVGGAGA